MPLGQRRRLCKAGAAQHWLGTDSALSRLGTVSLSTHAPGQSQTATGLQKRRHSASPAGACGESGDGGGYKSSDESSGAAGTLSGGGGGTGAFAAVSAANVALLLLTQARAYALLKGLTDCPEARKAAAQRELQVALAGALVRLPVCPLYYARPLHRSTAPVTPRAIAPAHTCRCTSPSKVWPERAWPPERAQCE